MSALAIERLCDAFGNPPGDNPQAFLTEIHRALAGCHEDKIARTLDYGIRHIWKFFPRPAEITALMLQLHPLKEPEPKVWPEPPKRTPEEIARVRAMTKDAVAFLSKSAFTPNTAEQDEVQRQRFIAAQRPGFEKMQRESRNQHLHRDYRPAPPSRKMAAAGDDA